MAGGATWRILCQEALKAFQSNADAGTGGIDPRFEWAGCLVFLSLSSTLGGVLRLDDEVMPDGIANEIVS